MLVKATADGHYNNKIIPAGTIFELQAPTRKGKPVYVNKLVKVDQENGDQFEKVEVTEELLFSERWMERVDADQDEVAVSVARTRPAKVQQAPDARDIDRVLDEQLGTEKRVSFSGGTQRVTKPKALADVGAGEDADADAEASDAEETEEATDKPRSRSRKRRGIFSSSDSETSSEE